MLSASTKHSLGSSERFEADRRAESQYQEVSGDNTDARLYKSPQNCPKGLHFPREESRGLLEGKLCSSGMVARQLKWATFILIKSDGTEAPSKVGHSSFVLF
ncbi:unnamed protein product [Anisakis simplex]|uniref:Uncharacterized protein n=1 Tax=Anisakis simplex TaxID=6269 RepID=A0A0M3JQ34_ANISI|nr:unnamed protein product [Anisakis simplex]